VIPRPLGCNLLAKVLTEDEMTESGLILPDRGRRRDAVRAIIVAVGPGHRTGEMIDGEPEHLPMPVALGDVIVFLEDHGTPVEINGEELLIVNEHNVLLVLEDSPDRKAVEVA
jgi:co-chaperonin GroES (HSP10)